MAYFTPSVLCAASTAILDDAVSRYAADAAAAGASAATVTWNIETAKQSVANGGNQSRDFVIAVASMALAAGEPVFVTAQWRRVKGLAACGAAEGLGQPGGWVEQRCLRFSDATDPPENIMIVGQPCVCQKQYMRVSFAVFAFLPHAPARVMLIGVGAGQLVEMWRIHLPPCAGDRDRVIDGIELHAEVLGLARDYFYLGGGSSGGGGTKGHAGDVTLTNQDGRDALERGATATYDMIVVDLSVGDFIDARVSRNLRRLLRPGGVCVHNYNFAGAATQNKLGPLLAEFAEVHRLTVSASNTILISCTEPTRMSFRDFPALIERAVNYPFATPLLFDLRKEMHGIDYDVIRLSDVISETDRDIEQLCGDLMQRSAQLVKRLHVAATSLGSALRETNCTISTLRQRCGTDACVEARQSLIEAVLLRKILAFDRANALDLARATSNRVEGIAQGATRHKRCNKRDVEREVRADIAVAEVDIAKAEAKAVAIDMHLAQVAKVAK